jgi:hypothetical protein
MTIATITYTVGRTLPVRDEFWSGTGMNRGL